MLRLTSALSVATWASLFVGLVGGLRISGDFILWVLLAISVLAIALSATMFVRNRPFLLGAMSVVSIFGLLPGLWGLGFLLYCVGITFGSSLPATAAEWFFAVALTLMLVTPINWVILWRDARHAAAVNI